MKFLATMPGKDGDDLVDVIGGMTLKWNRMENSAFGRGQTLYEELKDMKHALYGTIVKPWVGNW